MPTGTRKGGGMITTKSYITRSNAMVHFLKGFVAPKLEFKADIGETKSDILPIYGQCHYKYHQDHV